MRAVLWAQHADDCDALGGGLRHCQGRIRAHAMMAACGTLQHVHHTVQCVDNASHSATDHHPVPWITQCSALTVRRIMLEHGASSATAHARNATKTDLIMPPHPPGPYTAASILRQVECFWLSSGGVEGAGVRCTSSSRSAARWRHSATQLSSLITSRRSCPGQTGVSMMRVCCVCGGGCMYVCMYVCVCVYVCVCERERERVCV